MDVGEELERVFLMRPQFIGIKYPKKTTLCDTNSNIANNSNYFWHIAFMFPPLKKNNSGTKNPKNSMWRACK